MYDLHAQRSVIYVGLCVPPLCKLCCSQPAVLRYGKPRDHPALTLHVHVTDTAFRFNIFRYCIRLKAFSVISYHKYNSVSRLFRHDTAGAPQRACHARRECAATSCGWKNSFLGCLLFHAWQKPASLFCLSRLISRPRRPTTRDARCAREDPENMQRSPPSALAALARDKPTMHAHYAKLLVLLPTAAIHCCRHTVTLPNAPPAPPLPRPPPPRPPPPTPATDVKPSPKGGGGGSGGSPPQ